MIAGELSRARVSLNDARELTVGTFGYKRHGSCTESGFVIHARSVRRF